MDPSLYQDSTAKGGEDNEGEIESTLTDFDLLNRVNHRRQSVRDRDEQIQDVHNQNHNHDQEHHHQHEQESTKDEGRQNKNEESNNSEGHDNYRPSSRHPASFSSVDTSDLMDHRMHHEHHSSRSSFAPYRSFIQRRHSLSQGVPSSNTADSGPTPSNKGKGAPSKLSESNDVYNRKENHYNDHHEDSNRRPPRHRPRSNTISDFVSPHSFSGRSYTSEILGSEPVSRRSSASSSSSLSLLDVCLPIDSPENVSRRGIFDTKVLDEFAENERRENPVFEESMSEEASQTLNRLSASVLKSHTVNEVSNLEGGRLRPYRVIPWKNDSQPSQLPYQCQKTPSSPKVAYGGFKAPDDFNARNRKYNRYFDPYFMGIHDNSHRTGPPLRFTYFREDMESTIHSPSISGLLQDGQSFDDLFNLAPSVKNMEANTPDDSMALTSQMSNIATSAARHAVAIAAAASTGNGASIPGSPKRPIPRAPLQFSSTVPPQVASRIISASNTGADGGNNPSLLSPKTQPAGHALGSASHEFPSTTTISSMNQFNTNGLYQMPGISHSPNTSALRQANALESADEHPSPFWLDVMNPTEDEMKVISKTFGIHPLTTEDIMLNEPREKVELFRNYYLVCFRSFDINDEKSKIRASAAHAEEKAIKKDKRRKKQDTFFESDVENLTVSKRILKQKQKTKHRKSKDSELTPLNVYIIVFHEGVLTFHCSPTPHPMNVRRRIRLLRDYISLSSDWISYALIDDITDGFAPMIEAIDEEVNRIEEAILSMHSEWSDSSSDPSSSSSESESDFETDSGTEKIKKMRHTAKYAQEVANGTTYQQDEEEWNTGIENEPNYGSIDSGQSKDNTEGPKHKRHNYHHHHQSKPKRDSFSSAASKLFAKRWAQGSVVEPPTGGILGNAESAELYRQNAASSDTDEDESEADRYDSIQKYTGKEISIPSRNLNQSFGFDSVSPKSSVRQSSSSQNMFLHHIHGELDHNRDSKIPGALPDHIMVMDEESDDENYGSLNERQSLLSNSKRRDSFLFNQNNRGQNRRASVGYAPSIKSTKTLKSYKSKSSRSKSSKTKSTSSMYSWSSTASGRWKEQGDMLRQIGECRKRIMSVLRLLGYKADVIKGFSKRCNQQWDVAPRSEIGLYLGDIQDHIVTMVQSLNHYEKLLARSHSNYLAQINIDMTRVNNDMNDALSKITVLGTIVLPMNIVTGLWGMNVKVPGQDIESLTWFWSITGSLVIFACISFFIARRVYDIA